MKPTTCIRIVIAFILVVLLPQASPGKRVVLDDVDQSVGDLEIAVFSVKDGNMKDALANMRRHDYTRILIGFERVPQTVGTKDVQFSVDIQNQTVTQVLRTLCERDPRYEFRIVKNKLIQVRPRPEFRPRLDLLSVKIRNFSVHGNFVPAGIVESIRYHAPELHALLLNREAEFDKAHGLPPRGYPGVHMVGNMNPRVDMDLREVTVREILNQIVLYSLKLYQERPPDKHGWRIPPTSWMYEFVIDPRARTGLGGFPKWSSLD